jgi:hypothetical protein
MIALIACVLFIVGTGALVVLAFVLGGQMEQEFDEYNARCAHGLDLPRRNGQLWREQGEAFGRELE